MASPWKKNINIYKNKHQNLWTLGTYILAQGQSILFRVGECSSPMRKGLSPCTPKFRGRQIYSTNLSFELSQEKVGGGKHQIKTLSGLSFLFSSHALGMGGGGIVLLNWCFIQGQIMTLKHSVVTHIRPPASQKTKQKYVLLFMLFKLVSAPPPPLYATPLPLY